MNSVSIHGRIGQDVQLKKTSSGQSVANIRLANNEGFGDNRKTMWIDVVAWGKTAEAAAKFLSKGSLIGVEGKLQSREYESKSGPKVVYEVVARSIEFLDSRGEADRSQAQAHSREAAYVEPETNTLDDSDIPF